MNKVILTGNIGKIEGQYTPTGKYVCKGTLAVSVGWGDRKSTNWYNFAAWGSQGERMNEWFSVGTHILIDGTLELREWTDKDGNKHISPDVIVNYFELAGKRKEKEQEEETPYDEGISEE